MYPFATIVHSVLDKLDVRIIREFLQGEPLLSIWPARVNNKLVLKLLSNKLGVSESTIRSRYEKLSDFLSEGTFCLNPSLLGEKLGVLEFEVSETASKGEVLDRLKTD
jgi:hypothetical protein